jgi:hypothetical protein
VGESGGASGAAVLTMRLGSARFRGTGTSLTSGMDQLSLRRTSRGRRARAASSLSSSSTVFPVVTHGPADGCRPSKGPVSVRLEGLCPDFSPLNAILIIRIIRIGTGAKKRPAERGPWWRSKDRRRTFEPARPCPVLRSRAVSTDHVYILAAAPVRERSFHRRRSAPGVGVRRPLREARSAGSSPATARRSRSAPAGQ